MATTLTTTSRSLLLAFLVCASLVFAASASSSQCPSQVDALLAGSTYADCRRDLAGSQPAWVFTSENGAAVRKSDACSTALRALLAADFDDCVASLPSASGAVVRVAIDKQSLQQLASSSATVRRLRDAVTRVTRSLADGGSTFDYKYLYIGLAVFVAAMLVCCCLRGGLFCCCIPIPLCC